MFSLYNKNFGKHTFFTEHNLTMTGNLSWGKKEGIWIENYDKYIGEFTYINDVKEGPAKISFYNGDIEELNYSNGIKNGPATLYYPNGDIKKLTYKNDKVDGNVKIIHPDGTITEYFTLTIDD